MPGRAQLYEVENSPHDRTRGCSTPRSAIAKTQYGNVRGYVAGEVLHFKVPLIIGGVSEEGMQWSRNPTEPEWLASLAQALGEDKARRLVAAIAASVPKDDGRWRFVTY